MSSRAWIRTRKDVQLGTWHLRRLLLSSPWLVSHCLQDKFEEVNIQSCASQYQHNILLIRPRSPEQVI